MHAELELRLDEALRELVEVKAQKLALETDLSETRSRYGMPFVCKYIFIFFCFILYFVALLLVFIHSVKKYCIFWRLLFLYFIRVAYFVSLSFTAAFFFLIYSIKTHLATEYVIFLSHRPTRESA